jgi:MATE family multidrug resistance protein
MTKLDHKIWGIAWPAFLSNVSVPLLGLTDAAILGHLGTTSYLAAVAIGSAILSFMYWGFNFLRMGTTGLVARAEGAGDTEGSVLILAQSALLAFGLALLVWLSHPFWLTLGFTLMSPQPELQPLAQSYTAIRIISAPAVLLTYAIVGWFIGRQNTRWPMVIIIITNAANITLDFVFIIGLGLNSDGAAIATVIAEYLGLALAITAVVKSIPRHRAENFYRELRSWAAYRLLLRSNKHLFVRTICLVASLAFFTAAGDKLGTDTLAANAIMIHLIFLTAYGMDGIAFAAEGIAGTALGAGKLDEFYAAVLRCSLWCAATALLMSLGLAILHLPLFALLTNIPEVHALMIEHRYWLFALPLIAAPSYLLDGVFIGSAETRPMMTTMLFSALVVYIPVWYLSRGLGNHGLWLAFALFNASRGITLWFHYRRLSTGQGWLRNTNTPKT